jgi:hypothetical protein
MISSRPDELINRRLFGPNKRPIRPDDPLETAQADHPGETRRHRPFPVRRLRS